MTSSLPHEGLGQIDVGDTFTFTTEAAVIPYQIHHSVYHIVTNCTMISYSAILSLPHCNKMCHDIIHCNTLVVEHKITGKV